MKYILFLATILSTISLTYAKDLSKLEIVKLKSAALEIALCPTYSNVLRYGNNEPYNQGCVNNGVAINMHIFQAFVDDNKRILRELTAITSCPTYNVPFAESYNKPYEEHCVKDHVLNIVSELNYIIPTD